MKVKSWNRKVAHAYKICLDIMCFTQPFCLISKMEVTSHLGVVASTWQDSTEVWERVRRLASIGNGTSRCDPAVITLVCVAIEQAH